MFLLLLPPPAMLTVCQFAGMMRSRPALTAARGRRAKGASKLQSSSNYGGGQYAKYGKRF